MQKKGLKKFDPSLSPPFPQSLPGLASLSDKPNRRCRQTLKRAKVGDSLPRALQHGDEKEFSKKAIMCIIDLKNAAAVGRSDDGRILLAFPCNFPSSLTYEALPGKLHFLFLKILAWSFGWTVWFACDARFQTHQG
jgi:hypothetical protein